MCCAQGGTNITMAELPMMPLTPDGSHSGRLTDCLPEFWGGGVISAGRFADCQKICQQKLGGDKSASRFTDCHEICQQIFGGEICQSEQIFLVRLAGK